VIVKSAHEHAEGEFALKLRTPSAEEKMAPPFGPVQQLTQQAGLPDPRLPGELQHAGVTSLHSRQGPFDRLKLDATPDKLHDPPRHAAQYP
jgi:hypothetical protein